MVKIVVEVSKYLLLLIMVLFTLETFMVLKYKNEEAKTRIMRKQIILMLFFNFLAYVVMFLVKEQTEMVMIYLGVIIYILLVQAMYRLVYRRASLILVNTMCMLLSVGFVIQTRLGISYAIKQLLIVAVSTTLSMLIPVIVRKVRFIRQIPWVYGVVGILLLTAVLALSKVSGGANLSIEIGGITFQFSEFVKITFVFFIAGMLREVTDFRQVAITTGVAALHVIILVLSKDLGAALIYFMAYVVMVYVATGKAGYAALGLGGMGAASVVAYKLFSHIRVRFHVWRDPFADYQGTGYQIVQALFGVCAGGWFGTGLFLGSPEMIPLARVDFTYAAICEEMGILFGICLILLCMGMYFLIVNISMKLKEPFYKLVAIGLGTEYCFQVFLTIGGTTKFIPMTGVTLPLVSYGGSSVMCTIFMISIIQGLYILREDEDDALRFIRRKRQAAAARQQREAREQGQRPGAAYVEQGQRPGTAYGGQDQSTRPLYDMQELRTQEYMDPAERERELKDQWIRRQRLEEQQRKYEEEKRRVEQSGVPEDLEQRINEETEKSIHW
ncbi:MAG: FtsW/RodA/SpoVE family cell cycle protein [Lachnospiraceae bacterium]|nr:FtsW/RodA/SpoVE family cell cycle protein [Lachnospiraceae bacterium]